MGNIPKAVTEVELKALFAGHGDLEEVYIMRDRASGESKGCAFIKYAEYESASAAIQELHQKHTMEGGVMALIVKFADPPKTATGPGPTFARPPAAGARPLPPQPQQENRLFLGSLSKSAGEKEVQALMEQYGQLEEVYLMRERPSGLSKCAAFVKFKRRHDAENAIAGLNQRYTMPGSAQPMICRWANPPKSTAGQNASDGGQAAMSNNMGMAPAAQMMMQMMAMQQQMQQAPPQPAQPPPQVCQKETGVAHKRATYIHVPPERAPLTRSHLTAPHLLHRTAPAPGSRRRPS